MTPPWQDVWRNVLIILIPIQRVTPANVLHLRLTATTRRFVAMLAVPPCVQACRRRPLQGWVVTAGPPNDHLGTLVSSRRLRRVRRVSAGLVLPRVLGLTPSSLPPPATAPALGPCVMMARSVMTGRRTALTHTPCVQTILRPLRPSVLVTTPVCVRRAISAVQRVCAEHQCLVKICSQTQSCS